MKQVPPHFFHQSAVLPFRWHQGKLQVLMITSRRRKRWVIPKGVREPGMSAASSAAKEAYEEAGIEGEVDSRSIGSYSYEKWGGICSVEVFPMAVHHCLDDWPERFRDREWLSPRQAADRVTEERLRQLIVDFAAAARCPEGA